MNTILKYNILLLVLALTLSNCKDDGESLKVYMPAATAVVNATFDISDTVTYTATIVGTDYATVSTKAGGDVTVDFKVDADKVTLFNQSMGTDYTLLPAENYTIDASGMILSGEASTQPLNIVIKNGDLILPFASYLLPISIDKVNGGAVGNTQQTTYFILTRSPALKDLPTLDRTLWTVADKSTEEPGEGGGNGLAATAIDGNWGTYWHTKWAGSEPPPPHFIVIDMGEEIVLHGVSIVDRDLKDWAHGQPKSIKVSVSTDGETFVDNGAFSLEMGTNPIQKEIRVFLPSFKSARYLKITTLSTWGETNSSAIAEIYAL